MELEQLFPLPSLETLAPKFKKGQEVESILSDNLTPEMSGSLYAWLSVHGLGHLTGDGSNEASLTAVQRWRLDRVMQEVFADLGQPAERVMRLVKLLIRYSTWYELEDAQSSPAERLLKTLMDDEDAQNFLGVNEHEGVRYFNKESYRELTSRLACVAILNLSVLRTREVNAGLKRVHQGLKDFAAAEERSEYRVDKLLETPPKKKKTSRARKAKVTSTKTTKSSAKPSAKKSTSKGSSTEKAAKPKKAAPSARKTKKQADKGQEAEEKPNQEVEQVTS